MISFDGELLIDLAVGLYLATIIFVVQMLKLYDKVTGFCKRVFMQVNFDLDFFFLDDRLAVSRASLKFQQRSDDNVEFPQSVIYFYTSCARWHKPSKRINIGFSLLTNYRSDRKSAIFVLMRFIFDILSTDIILRCTP